MKTSRFVSAVVLAFALSASGAAFAGDAAPNGDTAGATGTDASSRNYNKEDMGKADRVICRKIQTIGSRLHAQRVCATAAQWSAMKQEEREGLDRIQTQRYPGNGT